MAKINTCNLVDFLWVDDAVLDDQDSHEKFRRAYEESEKITVNYRQSLFRNGGAYPKSDALNKLLYNKEQAGVLEVMLGLTSGPNTGLMFDDLKWIKPDYSTASDEIILNLSNDNKYTFIPEDYFFVNPHLSNQERHQGYLDYVKNQASNIICSIGGMKSDGINKQTFPTSSEIRQVTEFDRSCTIIIINPTYLVVPKSIENLPERDKILVEVRAKNGHQFGFLCKPSIVYAYEQPSSELVGKYIRFRKYWFAYTENLIRERKESNHSRNWQYQLSDVFPDEDSLLQYLEWVRQVLSYYEHQNTHSLPAVLSYALSTKLSARYPDVPSAIDFFNSLVRQDNAEVRVDKGYTVYKRHQPFIDMLINGIRELRGRPYDYYSKSNSLFLNEDQITANLNNLLKVPEGVVTELQVTDGKSFIDLLLRSKEPVAELAVEAKIAYKNGKLCTSKEEIPKALFVQAPAYAERFNCDACVVFYILNGDLLTVTNRVCEIVKSKSGWSISPRLAEKAPKHYVLRKKSGVENVDLLIDVLFVCLPSQSNTQKSRSNK
ncbi:hypothetical protein NB557_17415 [Vibrio alginolyticus]|uniref:hypothetical protein n=1 Tax=Vibrio antiquarius (strain Ex25) TaxID=150340 RepID=UPI00265826BC|nr:hypothetical protein [Vibrio antiquarius]MCE9845318.1 hypothetical protein [Vibrio antiquarius]MCR9675008.1 hypothetical protein [Vibrio alginolyticus]